MAKICTRPSTSQSSSSQRSSGFAARGAGWGAKVPVAEMLASLRSDREHLPALLDDMDEQVEETRLSSHRPVDPRRVEILNRLLELLGEQSASTVGVLQSAILEMLVKTDFTVITVLFYTPEEIDEGCVVGPSQPLSVAAEMGVDDRLAVTFETLELMLEGVPNHELARLLDAYTDHVQAMEMAWQVAVLEEAAEGSPDKAPKIRSASAIATWGEYAYIADSAQHMIFKVNIITNEIVPFCGVRGKSGFHDGPREVAKFSSPGGLAICEAASTLHVCDTGNDAIRMVGIPSGIVQTLSLSPADSDSRLEAPVGICVVRGEYEYEKDGSGSDDDDDEGSLNSQNFQECDDEDEDEGLGSRHAPLLEGITEEDEDMVADGRDSPQSRGEGGGWSARSPGASGARYALDSAEPQQGGGGKPLGLAGRLLLPLSQSKVMAARKRMSLDPASAGNSRRTSGYISSRQSRRASSHMSSICTSRSSRRTSMTMTMTPGETAIDSLRECTEEGDQRDYSLAVTGDHCIYLIKPDKGDIVILAGAPSEYGYRDAEKGEDARFSSLKGITCIRNCLFVADHWNNAIRCVNLKTRQVDTVVDFQPCGPLALTVSSSGSVYVLDSEYISTCNILKVCSARRSAEASEGALGTAMFQMLQDNIGRSRSSQASSTRSSLAEDLSPPAGCARGGPRRGSEAHSQGSSRTPSVDLDFGSRRPSNAAGRRPSRRAEPGEAAGCISSLGPALVEPRPPVGDAHPAGERALSAALAFSMHIPGTDQAPAAAARKSSNRGSGSYTHSSQLPVVPSALRSLVPGASLHPALVQMTMRSSSKDNRHSMHTALTGSQFHVSVVSTEHQHDSEEGPEFFSFLNPKHESPWKRIPIGTIQYVYQEATGQCGANTPLCLGFWDATDSSKTMQLGARDSQQLLVGGAEWPSLVKVLPPRKAPPQDHGRFRAVAADLDRVIMADSDSNQIFVVNHAKHSKDKIAGCGKAGHLDGPLDVCRMNKPSSIALDPNTHYIYVADSGNHRIRRIDLSTGFMTTVCGSGRKGSRDGKSLKDQSLDSPFDVHFMHPCHLLISCADNSIRRLDLSTSELETILVGS